MRGRALINNILIKKTSLPAPKTMRTTSAPYTLVYEAPYLLLAPSFARRQHLQPQLPPLPSVPSLFLPIVYPPRTCSFHLFSSTILQREAGCRHGYDPNVGRSPEDVFDPSITSAVGSGLLSPGACGVRPWRMTIPHGGERYVSCLIPCNDDPSHGIYYVVSPSRPRDSTDDHRRFAS